MTDLTLYCCMALDCNKCYKSKFNLKRHVEIVHFHIKHYECPICLSKFATNQNLKEHTHLHTGATPFSCGLCGQRFRQSSQLSLHKRKHAAQLETPCPMLIKEEKSTIDFVTLPKLPEPTEF